MGFWRYPLAFVWYVWGANAINLLRLGALMSLTVLPRDAGMADLLARPHLRDFTARVLAWAAGWRDE